jgi:UDP-glucose 4-epimerase|tara:strand:- start:2060 stop:2929 length:870 start_codon:yes stop_codon:yes gene_type:complete
MKVLITGAGGYLGSNLSNKVLEMGDELCMISRNTLNQPQKILDFNPDVVVHCAWSGGNSYKDINNISQLNNVSEGIKLIEIINKLPTKTKFIGFGTVEEYGILQSPALETQQENPINLYGLSKYSFKRYSKMLCETYNIDWGWVRPCYVYGPGDVITRLIPTVINKLKKNEKIILDKCEKLIDYMYIDDFINLTYTLLHNKTSGIYNISSGQQYILKDVISKIGDLMGKKENIIFKDTITRELTSPIICANNLKIINQSKIKKLTSLKTGLLKTILNGDIIHKYNNKNQ